MTDLWVISAGIYMYGAGSHRRRACSFARLQSGGTDIRLHVIGWSVPTYRASDKDKLHFRVFSSHRA